MLLFAQRGNKMSRVSPVPVSEYIYIRACAGVFLNHALFIACLFCRLIHPKLRRAEGSGRYKRGKMSQAEASYEVLVTLIIQVLLVE